MQMFSQPFTRSLPPVVYACHMTQSEGVNRVRDALNSCLPIPVLVATPGVELAREHFYVSPAAYHLLLEDEGRVFRFFDDEPYLASKPSINLFFMSCCGHEARSTLAILLSGANTDGADGLHALNRSGACCAVADPEHCQFDIMPRTAASLLENIQIIPHCREHQWLEKVL
ncbi:hypothetical protein GCM10009114_09950 [Aliiglaciecola litoralis]|uniref:protein-glutamate methylesterase n=2 Tax=Aliiglaciecola litoralis TaxID=582857 RepID=A0ABN1LEB1_9ALTE